MKVALKSRDSSSPLRSPKSSSLDAFLITYNLWAGRQCLGCRCWRRLCPCHRHQLIRPQGSGNRCDQPPNLCGDRGCLSGSWFFRRHGCDSSICIFDSSHISFASLSQCLHRPTYTFVLDHTPRPDNESVWLLNSLDVMSSLLAAPPGHGVPQELIDSAKRVSREFFGLR